MSYVAPIPEDVKARYPVFAGVADATIQIWLDDSARIVTDSWDEVDFRPARMALAAHLMALQGLGSAGGSGGVSLAGVTSFKSGTFSVTMSDEAAASSVQAGYGSTLYGREFLPMLRRNVGGAHLVGCAYPVAC